MAWEMLWLAGPVCIAMVLTLPETSADNILLRRARRLRKLTGRTDILSQSEVDQTHMTAKQITFNALIKPWEINILDPAVVCRPLCIQTSFLITESYLRLCMLH
jgi:DHA1 family multidrug resistance protein-like MFS transporter